MAWPPRHAASFRAVSDDRERLTARLAAFSSPSRAHAEGQPTHVVVVPPFGDTASGWETARALLEAGRRVRLVGHGVTLQQGMPDWVGAFDALSLTELGAYAYRYYVDEVAPIREGIGAWLDEALDGVISGRRGRDVFYGSATARIFQQHIDAAFFTGGLRLAHEAAEFITTEAEWPGTLQLGGQPAPSRTWRVELAAATAVALGGTWARQLTEFVRSAPVRRALEKHRAQYPQQNLPRLWLALFADWYRINRHLMDSIALPELERGRPAGVLLIGRLVPGTRDDHDIRKHVGDDPWAGLGPLKPALPRFPVDQLLHPESARELTAALLHGLRGTIKAASRLLTGERIVRREGLCFDIARHVWPLAQLIALDVERAIAARAAATRAVKRSRLRGASVVIVSSNFADISSADLTLQEAGATTIEFFHGAGAEGWVGKQESRARWRGLWTHADAVAIQRLGQSPMVAGMPRRVQPHRPTTSGPRRLLIMSNYVHRDYAVAGRFPYEIFQQELMRTPALLRDRYRRPLTIRWRPHPADNPAALERTAQRLEGVERSPNPSVEADIDWADVIVSTMSTAAVEALFAEVPIFLHVPPEWWDVPNVRVFDEDRIYFYAEHGADSLARVLQRLDQNDHSLLEAERRAREGYFGTGGAPVPLRDALERLTSSA